MLLLDVPAVCSGVKGAQGKTSNGGRGVGVGGWGVGGGGLGDWGRGEVRGGAELTGAIPSEIGNSAGRRTGARRAQT